MADEQIVDQEITKSDEEEQISYENTVAKSIDTLADVVQSIAQSQQGVEKAVSEISERVKALETPSDLPLSPKGTQGGDDVGAKVTAPNDPYPVGDQVGLDSFSTETPRPGNALENVDKSLSKDFSPILKDARENGFEGLSVVAQNILSGKYYKPTPEEIGGF